MNGKELTKKDLESFGIYLYSEEKCKATIDKYMRDVNVFYEFVKNRPIEKDLVIAYKNYLIEKKYADSSINSMLASVNSLLEYLNYEECKVKTIRVQRKVYCSENKTLNKAEYLRLLEASKQKPRLNLVIKTICATGIRISELEYFTVEAVFNDEVKVHCKNKTRNILVPKKLRKLLLKYAHQNGIETGMIFVTRGGKALDRSNIWKELKKLCDAAKVKSSKVFPHNFRKLFARTFYRLEKDIAKLADILGHESVETTRIYIMETGTEHKKKIEQMGLVC